MLRSYTIENNKIVETQGEKEGAIWYDILHPKDSEKKLLEEKLKCHFPSKKKMRKFSPSNRFYKREHALFMTASIVSNADTDPKLVPITFILNSKYFLTMRDAELNTLHQFKKSIMEEEAELETPVQLFLNLLETIVGRIAELAEKMSGEIDLISKEAFRSDVKSRAKLLNETLTKLGKKGDLAAKVQESLQTLERLAHFLNFQMSMSKTEKPMEETQILQQDMHSIAEHLTFLAHKINFLLDATLGYISIEQNGITKTFTTITAVFFPPTLIATIYGMNFHNMPELKWEYGYPIALLTILISAIFPFLYFKRKGWL